MIPFVEDTDDEKRTLRVALIAMTMVAAEAAVVQSEESQLSVLAAGAVALKQNGEEVELAVEKIVVKS